MPDATGRFVGISVPADAWHRLFSPKQPEMTDKPTEPGKYVQGCQSECSCDEECDK